MANKFPPRRSGAPMPRHRPTKFTEQQLAEALRRAGGLHAEACRVLDLAYGRTVTVGTMGRLVASSPRLRAFKSNVEDARLDYVESKLWRRIEAGDVKSILFYLRTKGAKRGYVAAVKHQGDPAKPVVATATFDFKGMPLDELRWLRETLSAAKARAAAARS